MENSYIFLLSFFLLAIGWMLGFYSRTRKPKKNESLNLSGDMKHRLQLLFDSYSDESIDRFIQSLEVTSETLPLHISIGKYFRTQGEVEKAILVHQNLMSHPELSSRASDNIVYELAKDYKTAGLFDRAQALLHQLKASKPFSIKSLKLLLDIHEAERDWGTALSEAALIDLKKHKDIALRVAQYHCEIGEKYIKEGLVRESIASYKQALSICKGCYRAHLGLANIAFSNQDFHATIQHLKLLVSIAPEQLVIALPLLLEATIKTNTFENHQHYLVKLLADNGQVSVMLALVESMVEEGALSKASLFLFERLHHSPSLAGLNCLFKLDSLSEFSSQDILSLIKRVLEEVYVGGQDFRCISCGFSVGQLHWLCPSCKSWQTIKPVIEYETVFQK